MKYVWYSSRPFISPIVPSAIDDSLAPPGKHVVTLYGGHFPYELKGASWENKKDNFVRNVLEVMDSYAPGFPDSIITMDAMVPLDIEREIGAPGGHELHGEAALDQLFFKRPIPHYADYRSPIRGLYQCGASTHPGGAVSGIPGHKAAREILTDARRRLLRPLPRDARSADRGGTAATLASLAATGNLHNAAVSVDADPVAGTDHLQRVLVEIRHRGHARHHGAEGNLGRYDVEEHRGRRGAVESGSLEMTGPPGRPLGAGEDQDLALERLSAKLMAYLGDGASLRVYSAETRDRMARDQCFGLRHASYYWSTMQHDGLAQFRPPSNRPVSAACTHCSVVPSQVSKPRIAGR